MPNQKPKTKYVENKEKTFINPYNFVRPSSDVQRGNKSEKSELVTGKLHCKLYVKTPLAILDTDEESINREGNGHQSYMFIRTSVDGKDVLSIPGSSIRGTVRSMYETITNSCFATLPENAYLSNRVATNDVYKPAILINGDDGWSIYDAERLAVNTVGNRFEIVYEQGKRKLRHNNTTFVFGDTVSVNASNGTVNSLSMAKNNSDNVLYIGEPFAAKKTKESVFQKRDVIHIERSALNRAINGLEASIEMYGKKTINKQLGNNKHTGYSSYYDAKKRGVIPVWCKKSVDHGVVTDISLSMAAIGRKVYKNTVNDLIGQGLVACHAEKEERENTLCPACQLFGTVRGSGYGSHVRFTDAICIDDMNEKPVTVTLKELGTPRTGFLPFYALNGIDYDSNGANINGRKFYWHNPGAVSDSSIYTTKEKTERNSTVEIAKKGMFEFDVFFDEISKEQLETLKWTLTLGENSKDSKYCYKLGHGKPLGLGSVKICISEQQIRKIGDGYSYSIQDNQDVSISGTTSLLNESTKSQIQVITDFELLKGIDICYPYIDTDKVPSGATLGRNDAASHKWFSEAKGVRSGEKATLLPDIKSTKENPLHPYSIIFADNPGNRGNNSHVQRNGNARRRTYNVGDTFEGTISGFNPSGKFAYVNSSDGGRASFYCGGKGTIGDSVRLEKTGVDDKGYDIWKKLNN